MNAATVQRSLALSWGFLCKHRKVVCPRMRPAPSRRGSIVSELS